MRNRLLNLFTANAKRGSFRAEGNTIFVYDVIVGSDAEAEFWGGVSPEAFAKALAGIQGDVVLRINSPGGDVFGARAMVQALREHKGQITAHVDGYAASAASLLAAAGDRTVMAEGSFIMIHNAWTITLGNAADHQQTLNLLSQIDGTIAQSYAARGKKTEEEFAALMAAETWLGPEAAVETGLADEIVTAENSRSARACWNLGVYQQPPAAPEPAPEPEPTQNANAAMQAQRKRAFDLRLAQVA